MATRGVHVERRLQELGYTLPKVPEPQGVYVPVTRSGNLLFLAGHLPQPVDGSPMITGKVGLDLTQEEGQEAAKIVALNAIATLKSHLGDLDKVKRIVKVVGFVNSTPDFTAQPFVINGFSNVMGEVFGEAGVHSRSAVGAPTLPLGVSVEVEAIVEVHEDA